MKAVHIGAVFILLPLTGGNAWARRADRVAMSLVPGGGAGPAYSFRMSAFEITNEVFAAFLNDAEANKDNARGSNLKFDSSGDVGLTSGYCKDAFYDVSDNCDSRQGGACPIIRYSSSAPVGSRYSVASGYEQFPVGGVSWLGSVKFCNWLTVDAGLGESARCYTEGSSDGDWHPVVIDTLSWSGRDLNDDERAVLVANYNGYRLAMDNLGTVSGPIGQQENKYNEWYKAAAYDPAAPDTTRLGPGLEIISPDHWIYGAATDDLHYADANFRSSHDLFEPIMTPVAYYNGVSVLDDQTRTRDAHTRWGQYDMAGGMMEWVQDQCLLPTHHALRGGSFVDGSGGLAASNRTLENARLSSTYTGFRVVRVDPCQIDVRKFTATYSGSRGKVGVNVRLWQNGAPPLPGWQVRVRTTDINNNNHQSEDDLKLSDERGYAKASLRFPPGYYLMEIIDIKDAADFSCMPSDCRRCLAVFTVPEP